MANRHSIRILGASHSNTHQSRNYFMNHGCQASASFYPRRMYPPSHQDNELADITTSTHPSHKSLQPCIPPIIIEDLA
ncbi:hypothetical protein IEQ34_003758 [Dendrobium chrysotoxum]|uniref:Uncharacterized protein n=1 Tax=Dendrobium chrysotoxum TaxID=161865 RepID=A0AAV7HGI0_DENCH|nr:hypothetical protein IEQ34_003758 [Dendrobium chrysotoxum]